MSALTRERMTTFAGLIPGRGTFPVRGNVLLFRGSLVCLDGDGRAMPGTTYANGARLAVGKSSATYNNIAPGSQLGGADDATDVEVEYGTFAWDSAAGADAITPAHVGRVAYVVDDHTVALTDGEGTRIPAGVITEVRRRGIGVRVYVHMGPLAAGAATFVGATMAALAQQIEALP